VNREAAVNRETRPALLDRYRDFLPVTPQTPRLTLGEGDTPLLPAPRLGAAIGCAELYLKIEGMNPTGSFKDRGMVMAVAKAMERGATMVACASTGNTAASAAAYAGRAGLRCVVILPAGYVAAGKLAQALAYGATVLAINGTFDRALELVREFVTETGAELVNSVNPFRLEGQKTGAFEVCDAIGRAPDVVALPVGNAGNITAYWQGFKEYRDAGKIDTAPAMWGFQAAGAAPLVNGHAVEHPETVATAIRIGKPARGGEALAAVRESGGSLAAVTDDQIMEAYRTVAALEGVMCEPASAASIAGLMQCARAGTDLSNLRIVAILTGHGLKDPNAALSLFQSPEPIGDNLPSLLAALGTV
jgi:threonine synthase